VNVGNGKIAIFGKRGKRLPSGRHIFVQKINKIFAIRNCKSRFLTGFI
jgi:hypothetical protein